MFIQKQSVYLYPNKLITQTSKTMESKSQLIIAERQLQYINNILLEDMPDWERKEWEATKIVINEEIAQLTEHIKKYKL